MGFSITTAEPKEGRKAKDAEQSPFGGCHNLLNHYRTIGTELLRTENQKIRTRQGEGSMLREFREATVFVPVEVLESFLDDLLDLDIPDRKLFIQVKGSRVMLNTIGILGTIASLVIAGYLAFDGLSSLTVLFTSAVIAIPCLLVWQFSPRGYLARRLKFARILSQEISRRHGHGRGNDTWSMQRLMLKRILRTVEVEPAPDAACSSYSR